MSVCFWSFSIRSALFSTLPCGYEAGFMPSSRGGQGFVSFETDIAKFERVHRAVRERREGRQATRYHVHGIHEYKGKFNPQVVRAFANILEFEPGETLLDPFCGSGTAVVEGLALGGDAYGIDRSPLAVLISRAKTATWRATYVKRVADELARWLDQAAHGMAQAQDTGKRADSGLSHLDAGSLAYLEGWFPAGSLAALSVALAGAKTIRSRPASLLAQVAISSIARSVSLQLPEDLRVRRRPADSKPEEVLSALRSSVSSIRLGLRELSEFPSRPRGRASVIAGSAAADDSAYKRARLQARRVSVITSPPYATALPYIDTDRLSLVLLGLAQARHLRELERVLYGSREWTTRGVRGGSARSRRRDLIRRRTARTRDFDVPPSEGVSPCCCEDAGRPAGGPFKPAWLRPFPACS